ncbi:MAG TPA: FISUMP domain-containing protein [Candidatus Saccharimonadales bacterium]|nr:FISUMP domain-containing protein [Candidatus Saccharimonadales bacterium]
MLFQLEKFMKVIVKTNLLKLLFTGAISYIGFNILAVNASATPINVGANIINFAKPPAKQCNIKVPQNYTTIQAAIDAANPGNKICIGPGLFIEDVNVNKAVSLYGNGFSSNGESVINGQGLYGAVVISASNVTVAGFEINGAPSDSKNAALWLNEFDSNVVIDSNVINANSGSNVLRADGGQNNHTFKNNIFVGKNSQYLARVSGTPLNPQKPSNSVNFTNNTFLGSSQQAIDEGATNSIISHNDFEDTADSGILIGYAYGSATGVVNYNNFITNAPTKVYVGEGTLTAKNNWWGDTDPSDNFAHSVIYQPFATYPYASKIPTTKIGSQKWMKYNLNVGTMIDGTAQQANNSIVEKHCYNNNPSNCIDYGGLYQWDEMMKYSTSKSVQQICPKGFHIPSDGEWKTMEINLGMSTQEANNEGNRGTDQGTKIKPGGSSGLNFPNAGYSAAGAFYGQDFRGWIWTSSQSSAIQNWAWQRGPQVPQISRDIEQKADGLSVRCIES